MPRRRHIVVPAPTGGWEVRGARSAETFPTQREAAAAARDALEAEGGGDVVVHGSDGTFRYQAKVSAGDARASVSPAARERVRTTVTIPPDVLEAAERHMARHGSKLQEAVLALARLGGREEQRRAEVERLAAQRRAIVRGRRRSGSSQTWPNPTELRSAILDED